MPGFVRGMARTAAVVGTATATRNAVNRRQAERNAQSYSQAMNSAYAQQSEPPQQYNARPTPQDQYGPPEPAIGPEDDMISQLERLGALKPRDCSPKKISPLPEEIVSELIFLIQVK